MPRNQTLLGVLVVIAIDLVIALLWIPLCSISGPDGRLAEIGVIGFVAAIWLGVSQWLLVGPFLAWAAVSGRTDLARAGLYTALVISGLWAIGFVIVILG